MVPRHGCLCKRRLDPQPQAWRQDPQPNRKRRGLMPGRPYALRGGGIATRLACPSPVRARPARAGKFEVQEQQEEEA
jgi:hypothetical protein